MSNKKSSFYLKLEDGSISGYFNIYQARNGKIYLQLGNCITVLTPRQINELNINCYNLNDFDVDLFLKAYRKKL